MESRFNILVVDDVAENVQVIGNMLNKEGYNALAALNGYTALKILDERRVELVLLDISMPEMDGYEVAQKIKENGDTKHLPIIFLTARTETQDIIKGFKSGGADYVTKPFKTEELLTRIENQLLIKRQQEQILEQNQQLQDLNATKDKFFSIIAHDLRNPFNLIINYAELLKTKAGQYSIEKQQQFLHSIYDSAQNANTLLENLLTWSRSQIGTMPFSPLKTNIHALVFDTITFLKQEAAQKGLHVKNFVPEQCYGYVDQDMMHIVMRNLMGNAVKFTEPEGVIAVHAAEKEEDGKKWVEIAVKDNGIGISAERLESLFSLEHCESTRGTVNEKGTGLGLILCREFVEKHGGSIWAESGNGKGSVFKFTIPWHSPDS